MFSLVHSAAVPVLDDALAQTIAPFGIDGAARVRDAIAQCPRYRPTPLRRLPQLARRMGLRDIWVKDERTRLGLRSFKALGGAYAVLCLGAQHLSRRLGAQISIAQTLDAPGPVLPDLTFAAATAGNHGCSVAAGARLLGARCRVFVADGVPVPQIDAIVAQGAHIVSVPGTYDDARRACSIAAQRDGWIVVSDCASDATDATVALVMQGYALIASEVREALGRAPSHVFVQAGVGGLAAAVAAHFAAVLGDRMPRVVVVESDAAACLQASARAGRCVAIPPGAATNMGRLACYAPSATAWPILRALASAYVAIEDADAQAASEWLAKHDLASTPSGAAGVAALERVAQSVHARERIGLGADSEVVVVVTEAPLGGA